MPLPDPIDQRLYRNAIAGDKAAAKIYCGSYMLVRKLPYKTGINKLYRHKGDSPPSGYVEVRSYLGRDVYDKDGFLIPQFWSLPRTNE